MKEYIKQKIKQLDRDIEFFASCTDIEFIEHTNQEIKAIEEHKAVLEKELQGDWF